MKRRKVYHAILENNLKSFLNSILLSSFFTLFYIYINNDEKDVSVLLIDWFGGTKDYVSISVSIVKLALISIIILQTSKTIQTLNTKFTMFLLPRFKSKKTLYNLYLSSLLISSGIVISIYHLLFYLLKIFGTDYSMVYIVYSLMDLLGLLTVITILFIFEVLLESDKGLMIILGVHIFNLIIPYYNILGISTSKLGFLVASEEKFQYLIHSLVLFILTLFTYSSLIKKKEIHNVKD